jgi:hypothetical protein
MEKLRLQLQDAETKAKALEEAQRLAAEEAALKANEAVCSSAQLRAVLCRSCLYGQESLSRFRVGHARKALSVSWRLQLRILMHGACMQMMCDV